MNLTLALMLALGLTVAGGWGWGLYQHHAGYEEGKTTERGAWEVKAAVAKQATAEQAAAVQKQGELDAAAVAAKVGPLAQIIRAGQLRAGAPVKVEVVFDPKCRVGAQVVEASNVGR